MHNIWLVIKHEIATTLGKRSFWLTTFVFPVLIMLITLGAQLLALNLAGEEQQSLTAVLSGQTDDQSVSGYIDGAEIIQEFPSEFPRALLRSYPTQEAAQSALEAGEIDQYYLIPADYVATGDLVLIQEAFSPFQELGGETLMQYLLTYNLTGDERTTQLLNDPAPTIVETALAPQTNGGTAAASGYGQAVAYAVLFIFFFLISMSSGYMLHSVSQEKENRVMEVLLLSLRPRDLMLGKILGLGVVALVQMFIWVGGGLLLTGGGLPIAALAILSAISLPPLFLLWALLYFLLGYLTFAAVLGAIGALAPNTREGNQFTFLIMLPLMLPLWFNTIFIEAPNGPLAVALSLFPLSAPVAMLARLATVTVPLWQVLVSLTLLAATTYGLVLLSARLFRADTLLSTASLNWKRLWAAVRQNIH